MIRYLLGMLIVLGAVGTEDYAIEAGLTPPDIFQVLGMSLVGLLLMYFGARRMNELRGDD